MKTLAAFAAAMMITTAAATAQTATPPTTWKLEVDQADLNAIATAINELPKKIADPLLTKLQGQIQAQMPKKAADQESPAVPEKMPDPKAKK